MNVQTQTDNQLQVLSKVKKDMYVFDKYEQFIGTVKFVYFGEDTPKASPTGDFPQEDKTLVEHLVGIFREDRTLPEPVRQRLLRHGYIHMHRKELLKDDAYATPEMIDSIAANDIYLNVTKDEVYRANVPINKL